MRMWKFAEITEQANVVKLGAVSLPMLHDLDLTDIQIRLLPAVKMYDLYLSRIFCDSEFFHGKDWYTVLLPRIRNGVNSEYWEKKISRNMERDNEINRKLNYLGWTVIRFWGKDISKNTEECIAVIKDCIFEQTVNHIECSYEPPDSLDEDI